MGGEYSVNAISNNMQTLRNYEYMLYGGSNYGTAAPSYANNYMGMTNYNNSYYPYANYNYANGYNPSFSGYGNSSANTTSNSANTNFQGLTNEEWKVLQDYYQKNNLVEDGFKGAVTGGLSFWAFENMQSIFHPINAFNAIKGKDGIKGVKEIFQGVKTSGSALNTLWKTDSYLMQEAYDATHKLIRDGGSKGFYSKWLRKPIESDTIKSLTEEMETALSSGNAEKIRAITEKMKAARGMNGRIPTAIDKIKTLLGGKSSNYATAAERLTTKGEKIKAGIAESKNMSAIISEKLSLNSVGKLIKVGFKKDFFGWMAFEAIFGLGKITTAFGKDTKTGLTQTVQTVGKTAGNALGWCAGKAVGGLAGAKLGAAIGSVCPGLGTFVGAVVGFIGGSVGMWAMGKITNKVFGKDAADKIEEEKMVTTPEGQMSLLQNVYQKAQQGEKMDVKTQQVLNKAINLYA